LVVTPNKNRLMQVRRTGTRKLFDRKRKEVFLEWFAATGNLLLAAERADIHPKTVDRHRLEDPAFADACDRALDAALWRLVARTVQEAQQLQIGQVSAEGEGPYKIGCGLDPDLIEAHFDPQLALQLLREHWRRQSGAGAAAKPDRSSARTATNAEVIEALTKRLVGFGLRVQREQEQAKARRCKRRAGKRRAGERRPR
jgi:hypothetical protein